MDPSSIISIVLFIMTAGVVFVCYSIESSKPHPKYVKLFSTEKKTTDSLLLPRKTLYYYEIYGITPKGKTRLIRNTNEYEIKAEAEKELKLLVEVLEKRFNII